MNIKPTEKYDLFKISDSRALILGIATLWVALFHSYDLNFEGSSLLVKLNLATHLNLIKNIGNSGVDFFLFLSGFGLYYSMERNRSLKHFYTRRFYRIVPEILIVSFIYYGYIGATGFSDWLSQVFLYGFFIKGLNGGRYWYFALIIVLYILYPLFHCIIKHWKLVGLIFLVALSISLSFIVRAIDLDYFNKIEIMLLRVPIFIIGIWFGQKAYNHSSIPKWIIWCMLPLTVVSIIFSCRYQLPPGYDFLWRYKYIPMVVIMTLAISYLCAISGENVLKRFLVVMGSFSLEMYLLYENMYLYLKGFFKISDKVGLTYAVAVFTEAFILSVALYNINKLLLDKVFANTKSR